MEHQYEKQAADNKPQLLQLSEEPIEDIVVSNLNPSAKIFIPTFTTTEDQTQQHHHGQNCLRKSNETHTKAPNLFEENQLKFKKSGTPAIQKRSKSLHESETKTPIIIKSRIPPQTFFSPSMALKKFDFSASLPKSPKSNTDVTKTKSATMLFKNKSEQLKPIMESVRKSTENTRNEEKNEYISEMQNLKTYSRIPRFNVEKFKKLVESKMALNIQTERALKTEKLNLLEGPKQAPSHMSVVTKQGTPNPAVKCYCGETTEVQIPVQNASNSILSTEILSHTSSTFNLPPTIDNATELPVSTVQKCDIVATAAAANTYVAADKAPESLHNLTKSMEQFIKTATATAFDQVYDKLPANKIELKNEKEHEIKFEKVSDQSISDKMDILENENNLRTAVKAVNDHISPNNIELALMKDENDRAPATQDINDESNSSKMDFVKKENICDQSIPRTLDQLNTNKIDFMKQASKIKDQLNANITELMKDENDRRPATQVVKDQSNSNKLDFVEKENGRDQSILRTHDQLNTNKIEFMKDENDRGQTTSEINDQLNANIIELTKDENDRRPATQVVNDESNSNKLDFVKRENVCDHSISITTDQLKANRIHNELCGNRLNTSKIQYGKNENYLEVTTKQVKDQFNPNVVEFMKNINDQSQATKLAHDQSSTNKMESINFENNQKTILRKVCDQFGRAKTEFLQKDNKLGTEGKQVYDQLNTHESELRNKNDSMRTTTQVYDQFKKVEVVNCEKNHETIFRKVYDQICKTKMAFLKNDGQATKEVYDQSIKPKSEFCKRNNQEALLKFFLEPADPSTPPPFAAKISREMQVDAKNRTNLAKVALPTTLDESKSATMIQLEKITSLATISVLAKLGKTEERVLQKDSIGDSFKHEHRHSESDDFNSVESLDLEVSELSENDEQQSMDSILEELKTDDESHKSSIGAEGSITIMALNKQDNSQTSDVHTENMPAAKKSVATKKTVKFERSAFEKQVLKETKCEDQCIPATAPFITFKEFLEIRQKIAKEREQAEEVEKIKKIKKAKKTRKCRKCQKYVDNPNKEVIEEKLAEDLALEFALSDSSSQGAHNWYLDSQESILDLRPKILKVGKIKKEKYIGPMEIEYIIDVIGNIECKEVKQETTVMDLIRNRLAVVKDTNERTIKFINHLKKGVSRRCIAYQDEIADESVIINRVSRSQTNVRLNPKRLLDLRAPTTTPTDGYNRPMVVPQIEEKPKTKKILKKKIDTKKSATTTKTALPSATAASSTITSKARSSKVDTNRPINSKSLTNTNTSHKITTKPMARSATKLNVKTKSTTTGNRKMSQNKVNSSNRSNSFSAQRSATFGATSNQQPNTKAKLSNRSKSLTRQFSSTAITAKTTTTRCSACSSAKRTTTITATTTTSSASRIKSAIGIKRRSSPTLLKKTTKSTPKMTNMQNQTKIVTHTHTTESLQELPTTSRAQGKRITTRSTGCSPMPSHGHLQSTERKFKSSSRSSANQSARSLAFSGRSTAYENARSDVSRVSTTSSSESVPFGPRDTWSSTLRTNETKKRSSLFLNYEDADDDIKYSTYLFK